MKAGNRTTRNTRRTPRSGRGFTLVELLVVISIVLLAAVVTLPSISKLFTATGDAQAYNAMAFLLMAARAQAIEASTYTCVHVQMADPNNHPDLADVCFMAVFQYDRATQTFIPAPGFEVKRLPGYMAFGGLTDANVSGNQYTNLDDAGMADFTTFNVVFTPSGAVTRMVEGGPVVLDTTSALFTGADALWGPPGQTPGVTAMTLFETKEMTDYDWDESGAVDADDRITYLDDNGQFLAINVYTGMLIDRASGE